jgi:hypothetical protein
MGQRENEKKARKIKKQELEISNIDKKKQRNSVRRKA